MKESRQDLINNIFQKVYIYIKVFFLINYMHKTFLQL